MKILQRRSRTFETEYSINYYWNDMPDAGFSFETDDQYNIDRDKLPEAALESLRKCENGDYDVVGPTPESYERTFVQPAIGQCDCCGEKVHLEMSLCNTCSCGAEYNASGQRLASRAEWGDDTGESIAEIMEGNLNMNGEY